MAYGHLQRRGRASRGAQYRDAINLQEIEETRVRIRLGARRGIPRLRSPQISKARDRDRSEAAPDKILSQQQPLVESTSGAVHCEDRRSIPGDSKLNWAARCQRDLTAACDPL